jgi:hypothetical protein
MSVISAEQNCEEIDVFEEIMVTSSKSSRDMCTAINDVTAAIVELKQRL